MGTVRYIACVQLMEVVYVLSEKVCVFKNACNSKQIIKISHNTFFVENNLALSRGWHFFPYQVLNVTEIYILSLFNRGRHSSTLGYQRTHVKGSIKFFFYQLSSTQILRSSAHMDGTSLIFSYRVNYKLCHAFNSCRHSHQSLNPCISPYFVI